MTRSVMLCLLAALLVASVPACRGQRLLSTMPQDQGAARRPAPRAVAPGRGRVALSDRDLAPVDAYIHKRNRQWILADNVEVYASKEYFSQVLTLNEKVGLVHRKEQQIGGDTLVTMTYVGRPGSASAQTNPRVMIGTGLTVSARRTITVRLMKTRNANIPIRLRVLARGKAVRGRKDTVTERGETLQLGGVVRWNGRQWRWFALDR